MKYPQVIYWQRFGVVPLFFSFYPHTRAAAAAFCPVLVLSADAIFLEFRVSNLGTGLHQEEQEMVYM